LNDGGVPNVVGTENPPLDGLDTGRFQGTREDQVKQKKQTGEEFAKDERGAHKGRSRSS